MIEQKEEDYPILILKNVSKEFPGVKALDNVNIIVNKGEVHALLGENGAGKSTLMKSIMGIYEPTEGEIWFDGKDIASYNIDESLGMDIAMIHQELNPAMHMTIMENIWLGREPKNGFGFINHKEMYQKTQKILDSLNLNLKADEKLEYMSVAQLQMVEIAKALSTDAKLIIMDEPTSSLTNEETEKLFSIINTLKENDVSVIYITHKLEEVFQLADRITILRDGKYVATKDTAETSIEEVTALMVGRSLKNVYPERHKRSDQSEARLIVNHLSDGENFEDISFTAYRGEIIGFYGLVGAGRTELMESIFGINPPITGEIIINNETIEISDPSDAIDAGLAFLTEDRRTTGIFPHLSVEYNTVSSAIENYEGDVGFLNHGEMREDADEVIDQFTIQTPSADAEIQNLSGGNQQKVLIGKWLLTNPDILILDEPTRGIDVGAKSEIYEVMAKMADKGKTILMVSSEMPEILGMSDRIVVMHEGKIAGVLDNKEVTQEQILTYATGQMNDFNIKNKI